MIDDNSKLNKYKEKRGIGGSALKRIQSGNDSDRYEKDEDVGRLFNSHLSVFNALTNPDLELSPDLRNHDLSKMPTNNSEKYYIDESWQNLNDSFFRNLSQSPLIPQIIRPSSLLSITTDEDRRDDNEETKVKDDTVLLDSMVFETDEEEDFKDTFIMPKMSMSSSNLSICTIANFPKSEISDLLESSKDHDIFHVNIKNFNQKNIKKIKSSNLIFVINDGSNKLVDFLKKIFEGEDLTFSDSKITIVNMITVNYFSNLFDLINNFKPFQIWKTSSVNSSKLIKEFNEFINSEISHKSLPGEINESSVYSSLITTTNSGKNYKFLEKKFKNDLFVNSNNVDPLQLKKFQIFNNILNKSLNDDEPNESFNKLYMLASFTIGISLGFTLANILSKYFTFYLSQDLITPLEEPLSVAHKQVDLKSVVDNVKLNVINLFNSNIIDEFSRCFFSLLDNLKFTGGFLINYASSGLDKLMTIV